MTEPIRLELQAALDRAAAGERQTLTTCTESDLVAAGVFGGVGRRKPDGEVTVEQLLASAERVQQTIRAGGPLADMFALNQQRRHQLSYFRVEPVVANPTSISMFAQITVLTPNAELAMVLSGSADAGVDDLPVSVELVRCAELVAEFVQLAYRDPQSQQEAAVTPGTEATFLGPDRKTPSVPSRLVHDWHAGDGALHAWAYDLFARRTERDWVGRKPMVIKHNRPGAYAKHLRKRLGKPGA